MVIVRPRKSTCCTPKWHFAIFNFNPPVFCMKVKTTLWFRSNSWGSLASTPMSSTNCAHRSSLMTEPRYSGINLEKVASDLPRPWTSLRFAKVRLAKLNIDLWSALCRKWYACEKSNLQKSFFPAMCCAAYSRVLMGWLLFMQSSEMRLLIFIR